MGLVVAGAMAGLLILCPIYQRIRVQLLAVTGSPGYFVWYNVRPQELSFAIVNLSCGLGMKCFSRYVSEPRLTRTEQSTNMI